MEHLVPTAALIPTRFFSGRTDVRQNWMEVHKETQTFPSLHQTLEEFKSGSFLSHLFF